jgi:hypothetical protein
MFYSYYSKLPYWIQSILPRIFYVTEKAWNYYPFTITGIFIYYKPSNIIYKFILSI